VSPEAQGAKKKSNLLPLKGIALTLKKQADNFAEVMK
jgi:hypothetical protein